MHADLPSGNNTPSDKLRIGIPADRTEEISGASRELPTVDRVTGYSIRSRWSRPQKNSDILTNGSRRTAARWSCMLRTYYPESPTADLWRSGNPFGQVGSRDSARAAGGSRDASPPMGPMEPSAKPFSHSDKRETLFSFRSQPSQNLNSTKIFLKKEPLLRLTDRADACYELIIKPRWQLEGAARAAGGGSEHRALPASSPRWIA